MNVTNYHKHSFTFILYLFCQHIHAQNTTVLHELQISVTNTKGESLPFWFKNNQFGSIPLKGQSGSFTWRSVKPYYEEPQETEETHAYNCPDMSPSKKMLDWGAGIEVRGNLGKGRSLDIIEAYMKTRISLFEIKVGRSRDIMGYLGDSSLSSGAFAISGNALGVPKMQIAIPVYYPLRVFKNKIAIKGNFAHGWLGTIPIAAKYALVPAAKTYFHQASLYIRIGTPLDRIKLYGGINHEVFWGSERRIFGPQFAISPFTTFLYAATGKVYGSNDSGSVILVSKIGNHLGSIDMAMEIEKENSTIRLYKQNFYDVGALSKLGNILDGLYGIAYINKQETDRKIRVNKWLFEIFYSMNQSGELWSPVTKSGAENYYNNYVYTEGWSYRGQSLGNPFITMLKDARAGQVSDPDDYYINNRVFLGHVGADIKIGNWNCISKLSYSHNWGTYFTADIGRITASGRYPPRYGVYKPVWQFSGFVSFERQLENKMTIAIAAAADKGKLLNDALGLSVSVKKTF